MNLAFTSDEEDDILNATVRSSETGSVAYTIETPKFSGGTMTTTVRREHRVYYGSSEFLFRILWKGAKGSFEDVMVVVSPTTLEEVPVREVLKSAPGGSTYGSVFIGNVEYRWKSKGTGTKVVLVNQVSNKTVAQSHSMIRSSFFRKPRDMSLEISEEVSPGVDTVLLTFILVWRERQNERSKGGSNVLHPRSAMPPLSPLPVEN